MFVRIEPSDARPIYQQIIDEIRRLITLGNLRTDDALPSVRELAAELRVNPNTVSQAYRELERGGVVFTRRGQGTFVARSGGDSLQRRELAQDVALRALRDAYRHGMDADDLIRFIRAAAKNDQRETRRG